MSMGIDAFVRHSTPPTSECGMRASNARICKHRIFCARADDSRCDHSQSRPSRPSLEHINITTSPKQDINTTQKKNTIAIIVNRNTALRHNQHYREP